MSVQLKEHYHDKICAGQAQVQIIKTVEDVVAFFEILRGEGLNFHPDDNFADYIRFGSKMGAFDGNGNYIQTQGTPFYTPAQARIRESMLNSCFEVCSKAGEDIYTLAEDVFMSEVMKQVDEMEAKWEARKYGENIHA